MKEEENLAPIALMLTQANFEQDELYGSHLGMSEEGLVILLRRMASHSLNDVTFDRQLREFVETAEMWSDSIASIIKSLREYHGRDNHSNTGTHEMGVKV